MGKIIVVPSGEILKLARQFKTSRVTVYKALRFISSSELAERIRKSAVESHGGGLYVNNKE